MESGWFVTNWNFYSLLWAPVNVVEFPSKKDKSLMFRDSEPYDYARAQRVFPESQTVTLEFELMAKQNDNGRMEVDLLSKKGERAVCVMLGDNGKVKALNGEREVELGSYKADKWLKFKIIANVKKGRYRLSVNGKNVLDNASFVERTTELQRVSFRTGEYRKLGIGRAENAEDLPNAGDPVKEAIYYINNVWITP